MNTDSSFSWVLLGWFEPEFWFAAALCCVLMAFLGDRAAALARRVATTRWRRLLAVAGAVLALTVVAAPVLVVEALLSTSLYRLLRGVPRNAHLDLHFVPALLIISPYLAGLLAGARRWLHPVPTEVP